MTRIAQTEPRPHYREIADAMLEDRIAYDLSADADPRAIGVAAAQDYLASKQRSRKPKRTLKIGMMLVTGAILAAVILLLAMLPGMAASAHYKAANYEGIDQ